MAIATKKKASKKAKKAAAGKSGTSKAAKTAGKPKKKAASKAPAKVAAKAASKKAPATKATTPPKASKARSGEPERSAPKMAEVDADVLEFIAAIDAFKQQHGRPFPSWSEVLLIVRQLGYKR